MGLGLCVSDVLYFASSEELLCLHQFGNGMASLLYLGVVRDAMGRGRGGRRTFAFSGEGMHRQWTHKFSWFHQRPRLMIIRYGNFLSRSDTCTFELLICKLCSITSVYF